MRDSFYAIPHIFALFYIYRLVGIHMTNGGLATSASRRWFSTVEGSRRSSLAKYENDGNYKGELIMKTARNIIKPIIFATLFLTVLVSAFLEARAQETAASYPNMAPIDQYLMADRNAEIAMARSSAPPSISADAEVMVLGRRGYETAVKGKNGFVCLVERLWMSPFDFPEFWNPKMRGPICFNPAAVRSILPLTFKRTELVSASLTDNSKSRKGTFLMG